MDALTQARDPQASTGSVVTWLSFILSCLFVVIFGSHAACEPHTLLAYNGSLACVIPGLHRVFALTAMRKEVLAETSPHQMHLYRKLRV